MSANGMTKGEAAFVLFIMICIVGLAGLVSWGVYSLGNFIVERLGA